MILLSFIFFSQKHINFIGKANSSELRCPATALIKLLTSIKALLYLDVEIIKVSGLDFYFVLVFHVCH